MRTTGALEDLVDRLPVPLLSSNLALAHWLLKHCGPEQGHGSVLFRSYWRSFKAILLLLTGRMLMAFLTLLRVCGKRLSLRGDSR